MRKIVNLLVDIHSQMDTYRLMDTSVQMELLDSYAKTMDLKASVKEAMPEVRHVNPFVKKDMKLF